MPNSQNNLHPLKSPRNAKQCSSTAVAPSNICQLGFLQPFVYVGNYRKSKKSNSLKKLEVKACHEFGMVVQSKNSKTSVTNLVLMKVCEPNLLGPSSRNSIVHVSISFSPTKAWELRHHPKRVDDFSWHWLHHEPKHVLMVDEVCFHVGTCLNGNHLHLHPRSLT